MSLAGNGPWLLSARTLLLPWAFCCQRQQDTLMWPCQCSLCMQLACKGTTRVQIVNLPWRPGFWVPSPVLKFFWLSWSKADHVKAVHIDPLIYMRCCFRRKLPPLLHLLNLLPPSSRKTNILKDWAGSKGFLSSCQKKVSLKQYISQMRPGIIQSGRTKQTQPPIRSCSSPLFILLAEEMHFRLAFISLGLLFLPHGQLGIWAMKEKLAALCSVRGNVYLWPRI